MNQFNKYNLFGRKAEKYISILNDICNYISNNEYKYVFLSDQFYLEVGKKSVSKANELYWLEIIQLCHLTATTSLLRNQRWINGVHTSISDGNFITFSSSLRGLIESAADSYDALKHVASTLALNYKVIKTAMDGRLQTLVTNEELENLLLHYVHAKKGNKKFQPKQPKEYIKVLSNTNLSSFYKCYSELCEIVHPASASVSIFINDFNGILTLNNVSDYEKIRKFHKKHNNILPNVLRASILPALMTLKVINYFSIKLYSIELLNKVDLLNEKEWVLINKEIHKQSSS